MLLNLKISWALICSASRANRWSSSPILRLWVVYWTNLLGDLSNFTVEWCCIQWVSRLIPSSGRWFLLRSKWESLARAVKLLLIRTWLAVIVLIIWSNYFNPIYLSLRHSFRWSGSFSNLCTWSFSWLTFVMKSINFCLFKSLYSILGPSNFWTFWSIYLISLILI